MDLDKLSGDGQLYYSMMSDSQKQAATKVMAALVGFSVSQALLILDYAIEAADMATITPQGE